MYSRLSGPTASSRLRRVWLDLGDPGAFVRPSGTLERWQDHGLGLLRTILRDAGIETDVASVRSFRFRRWLARHLARYDVLLMNVRSYTFPLARRAAEDFKARRPDGVVIVGGMHASVALAEMESVSAFDRICVGAGERSVVDLVADFPAFPRVVQGVPARSLADWPMMDRTLWPNPRRRDFPWPLEPSCGWGPGPVATVLTSRVCPWRCAFCNELSYIPPSERRPVEMVIDELNHVDRRHGPVGSVVIHDSMFFQQPSWLRDWLREYPRRARRPWPYWAAARADTVRRWPDLFESLVRETNWSTVSIGFESGSDRVLKILNKECTAADNHFAIELLNRIGDDYVRQGKEPPKFWANIMLGVPGESREDAFETMRMLRRMRYVLPSISFYAPYPGSALGYQLIAEGKSAMTSDNYHRYPSDEKVRGVDYQFYRDLVAGRYETETSLPWASAGRAAEGPDAGSATPCAPHAFYLFETASGKRKLAYGASADDAFESLRLRLSAEELAGVRRDRHVRIHQRALGSSAAGLE
jgi:anaerobic magnesium-protoporphyrin IX monomethyl ester cyclase